MKQRTVSGIKWSAVSQGGRQATQLLTTIILARLVSPTDFGLLGMAMVVIGFINIFKDLGTAAAVIQHKELSQILLSSLFWVNVVFGLAATVVLFLLAPLISIIYHEPRVTAVLQVLSTTFLISSLGILHQALLERCLSFVVLAKLELTSVIVGAIAGIVLALFNGGVWSLVLQSLITALLATLLLWRSSSWRPNWTYHWKEIKGVSHFSLNLTGFSIFNYFARNADYFLIGRYLGAEALGYYTLAYRILLFPLQNISDVIGRVLYPVLSTIQDNNKKFSAVYLKVVQFISLITFPLMLGLLSLAAPVVLTFFGQKWEPVILLIMIFAPVGMAQSIGTTVGVIYQAKGRTDWMFRWGVGSGIFVVVTFILGLRWGINGVAVAYAVAVFILAYPSFAIPFRLIELNFVEMLKVLRPSFLNSSLMFVAVLIFRAVLPLRLSNVVVLVSSFIIGVTVYGLGSWYTNQEQIKELWELLGSRKLHEAE